MWFSRPFPTQPPPSSATLTPPGPTVRLGDQRQPPVARPMASVDPVDAPAASGRRIAYDPARPLHGGGPVELAQAPATVMLAMRAAPLPPCAATDVARAQGDCMATWAVGSGQVVADVRGALWLDEQRVVHLERGSASIRNLQATETLVVVDSAGRSYRVPPMGKVDVSDAPLPAAAPSASGGGEQPTEQPGPEGSTSLPSGMVPENPPPAPSGSVAPEENAP